MAKTVKDNKKPVLCVFQAYKSDYIRTETILKGLKDNSDKISFVECKVNEPSPLRYVKAIIKFIRVKNQCDVVLVNFRCHEIFWLVRLLTRKPVIYDGHISVWQSACEERKWFSPNSIPGKMLFYLDKWNCKFADKVLEDTKAHAEYFIKNFDVPRDKIFNIYVSCEDSLFYPRPQKKRTKDIIVTWNGGAIPVQGFDKIFDAFRELKKEKLEHIKLRIAGWSDKLAEYKKISETEKLNIEFLGQLPRAKVIDEIANADICLGGHHSTYEKAKIVVSGKAYEMVAMKKAVIIGENDAVKELFTHKKDAYLCKLGSTKSLVEAIKELASDEKLRKKLAQNAYKVYQAKLLPKKNVMPLIDVVYELANRK